MRKRMGWLLRAGLWGGLAASGCGQELEPHADATVLGDGAVGSNDGVADVPVTTENGGHAERPRTGKPSQGGWGGAGDDERHLNEGGRAGGAHQGAAGGDASATPGTAGENASAMEAPPPALLLSEYVEGSGRFKALEIFAITGGSLERCELRTYSNGKTEPSRLALHGELASGANTVLCSPELAANEPLRCQRSTNLIFNGDDALAIACDDDVQDVFGQIGVDPGDSWDLGATLDHTLRRRCAVTSGRSDGGSAFRVDAEWETLGVDTFADLGQRRCP